MVLSIFIKYHSLAVSVHPRPNSLQRHGLQPARLLCVLRFLHWPADSLPLAPHGKPWGSPLYIMSISHLRKKITGLSAAVCRKPPSEGFPYGTVVKNPPTNTGARETRVQSLEKGNGNPLQYSCLENPMDREAWRATVYVVTESETTQHLNDDKHQQEAPSLVTLAKLYGNWLLNQAPPCCAHLRLKHTFQIFSSHSILPILSVLLVGQRKSLTEMKHK